MKRTALDNAVYSLVRAAAGSGARSVPDDDLESYVASLITREAKALDDAAKQSGVAAYSIEARKRRMPKPNTRFLSSLVRQTDQHNYSLILEENRRSRERLDAIEQGPRRHSLSPDGRKRRRKRRNSDDSSLDRNYERDHETREDITRELLPPSASPPPPASPRRIQEPTRPASSANRQVKGRGTTSSARLDKFFEPHYNPRLDIDNYNDASLEHYVNALEEITVGKAVSGSEANGGRENAKRKREKKDKKDKKSKRERKESRKEKKERKRRKKEKEHRKERHEEGEVVLKNGRDEDDVSSSDSGESVIRD
ncbi:hypothetical protein BC830DRAFT_1146167 [Chytriomyces sp. MP71]|nr:hypothetical protein BC830DRAFT_1146167 [Chytriomyces sp. MP71]